MSGWFGISKSRVPVFTRKRFFIAGDAASTTEPFCSKLPTTAIGAVLTSKSCNTAIQDA